MGYVYGGTEFDAHLPVPEKPKPKRDPKPAPQDPKACGTYAGYRRHIKAKEPTCQPCKDANAAYARDYDVRNKAGRIKKGWTPDKCGTVAGWNLHNRHAYPMCAACRDAYRVYRNAHRAKQRQTTQKVAA